MTRSIGRRFLLWRVGDLTDWRRDIEQPRVLESQKIVCGKTLFPKEK
jgi:hypothetical protein